jgi:hypothetical protein
MAELLNAKRARRASSGPIDRLDELVLSHPLAVGGDRQAQHEALGLDELSGCDHERRLACRHLRPLGRHVVVDLLAQQLPHLRLRRGERSRQQVDVAQSARFLADSARRTRAIRPHIGDEEPDEKPEDQSERCHQPRAERPQRGVVTASSHHQFDWLAWWAGRQWGAGIIRIFTASERAQRYAARATEWNPWVVRLAVVIAVLPGIPTAVVYAAAGWARMRPATFLLLDLVGVAQACRSRDGRHIEPRISSPAHPPRRCGNAAATGRPRREPATQPHCAVSQSARSASAARQPWVPRTT